MFQVVFIVFKKGNYFFKMNIDILVIATCRSKAEKFYDSYQFLVKISNLHILKL